MICHVYFGQKQLRGLTRELTLRSNLFPGEIYSCVVTISTCVFLNISKCVIILFVSRPSTVYINFLHHFWTMSGHHDLPFQAEYAKSGRASCKGCKSNIAQDSLRLALMVQVPYFSFNWKFFLEPWRTRDGRKVHFENVTNDITNPRLNSSDVM